MNVFSPPPAFAGLSFAEQLTLWALRMRRAADTSGEQGAANGDMILARAFDLVGAPGAERYLGEFLTMADVTAEHAIHFREPACPRLAADELAMLDAIATVQAGRDAELAAALGRWLPPAGARLASAPLRAYGAALKAQGLSLRRDIADAAGAPAEIRVSHRHGRTLH